jgi:hypothetical protein
MLQINIIAVGVVCLLSFAMCSMFRKLMKLYFSWSYTFPIRNTRHPFICTIITYIVKIRYTV